MSRIEDIRIEAIRRNLSAARRVYAAMSVKGGVGKTTISVILSYALAERGYAVGLADLDLVNPSTHVILGIDPSTIKYEEQRGIRPFKVTPNLSYATFASFTGDMPIGLRGASASNALREFLAILKWGDLDFLFLDMPPGLGDEHMDLIYGLKGIVSPLVIATPSKLALRSVGKLLEVLKEAGFADISLIENMGVGELKRFAEDIGARYLGYIPFSKHVEMLIGDLKRLRTSEIYPFVNYILDEMLKSKR